MTISPAVRGEAEDRVGKVENESLPALTTAVRDAKATRELMFTLRHFHLGDPAASERLARVEADCLPALLNPYRDSSRLRYHYPLVLLPPGRQPHMQQPGEIAQSLADWLRDACSSFAPDHGEARILRDHLPWLEHRVRERFLPQEGPSEAGPVLAQATEALLQHLKLADGEQQHLASDIARLLEQLPEQAQLLGYDRHAAMHLLIQAVRCQALPRRDRLREQIDASVRGLKQLFEVEWRKSDESIEPRMARDSIGIAGEHFDPAALSAVMDHSRGTAQMSAERRRRIENALSTLESWQPDPLLMHFIHAGDLSDDWLQGSTFCGQLIDSDPCASAMGLFDRLADSLATLFSALRIAGLEIKGVYDPLIHDPWFANFHWSSFSQEELRLVPTVVVMGSAAHLAGEGLRSLSRLLSSGRPVQILVRVRPHDNPGALADEGPFQAFRSELGYLGISHRQACVAQSSAARHDHLLRCFLSALEATRTSLHVINTGLRPPGELVPLNAWLVAGAAIEGRAHPFFRVNPEAGDSAAQRMDFSENPQQEADWPRHPFRYRDENGEPIDLELCFTFADYALLIGRLRDQFRVVPPECDSDALVPVEAYLAMEPDQAHLLVPFVWAVDSNLTLHRLVVSIDVTNGARDRRNYWRALQEMAGVRNRYVEQAIARTREEERVRAEEERERLLARHAEALQQVRTQAAGEAMQRLTDMLLGLDAGAPPPAVAAPPARASAAAEPVPEPQPAAPEAPPEEPEEDLDFDQPWIDTPLCTSCNDCLKVNARLFLYNEEKQARMGDPSVGTFAQLVEAAELCPAKCIHPGKPLDPNEPGLAALIERAAPFNQ